MLMQFALLWLDWKLNLLVMLFFMVIFKNNKMLNIVLYAVEVVKMNALLVRVDILYIQCLLDLAGNVKMARFLMKFMIVFHVILIAKAVN